MMDIAFLTIPFMKSGREATEVTITSLANALMDKGCNVSIICRRVKGMKKAEMLGKVKVYRPFKSELLTYLLGVYYIQKVRGKKFDIAHGFSAAPIVSFRTYFAKKFCRGLKTVNTLKSYSRRKVGNRFYSVLSNADAVTVPTTVFKRKLVLTVVPEDKISVIRSNIDTTRFKPKDKKRLKKKYGFKGKVVLYYGALWEEKGPQYLMDAVPHLKKPATVLIAPRHNIRKVDAQLIRKALSYKNVKVIREIKEIVDYINLADVVVLPYKNLTATEGNPSCLLEGMACKTPVITSDLPEIKEIAKGCVVMTTPGDVKELAKQIDIVSQRFVSKAYSKSKEFDVKKVATDYLHLYSKLL